MIYVISDIHGHYDQFITMLELIDLKDDDSLFILGDVIDRGPASIKLLQYIMSKPNIKMILGNHEEMMLLALGGSYDAISCWLSNGGQSTLDQFKILSNEERFEIVEFLNALPLYYCLEKFLLLHAGTFGALKKENLDMQSREDLLWSRGTFFNNQGCSDMITIFGHTPTHYIPSGILGEIWQDPIYKDKIGIDCGVQYPNGHLGCLCLNTFDEYYV